MQNVGRLCVQQIVVAHPQNPSRRPPVVEVVGRAVVDDVVVAVAVGVVEPAAVPEAYAVVEADAAVVSPAVVELEPEAWKRRRYEVPKAQEEGQGASWKNRHVSSLDPTA